MAYALPVENPTKNAEPESPAAIEPQNLEKEGLESAETIWKTIGFGPGTLTWNGVRSSYKLLNSNSWIANLQHGASDRRFTYGEVNINIVYL